MKGRISRSKGWVNSPHTLSGRLRREATFLRKLGIEIEFVREGMAGKRIIRIRTNSDFFSSSANEIEASVASVLASNSPLLNDVTDATGARIRHPGSEGKSLPPIIKCDQNGNMASLTDYEGSTALSTHSLAIEPRKLYLGDNLSLLRAMASEFVDSIATDPPFNTGKTWIGASGAFDDKFGDTETFVEWMRVRVVEMRRILKPTGSICLHCDFNAFHYLKIMMDEVFGKEKHRNDIIRQYGASGRGSKASADHLPHNHDFILYYAKDIRKSVHNPPSREAKYPINNLPSHVQRDEEGYFKTAPASTHTDKRIEELRREGRIHETKNGNPRVKYHLRSDGRFVYETMMHGSVWSDIGDMMHVSKNERSAIQRRSLLPCISALLKCCPIPATAFLIRFVGAARH